MNFLFDLIATQPVSGTKYHGGGEYAKLVFQKLINNKNLNILACYNSYQKIDNIILRIAKENGISLLSISNKFDIEQVIQRYKINRFYSALPYNYHDLYLGEAEFIYTIHGLRPLEMPTDRYEMLYTDNWFDRVAWVYKNIFGKQYLKIMRKRFEKLLLHPQTSKIIVPSNHTKYALLAEFPFIDNSIIEIIYSPRVHGVLPAEETVLHEYGIEKKKFVLLISANRWLKNAYRALIMMDELFTLYPSLIYKILVLGIKPGKVAHRFIHSLKNRDRFVFCGYVSREQLERFYQDAFCFIYPTLNEGFGYPPLECMKYGTPVIASAITAIPEICGNGVVYIEPFGMKDLKSRFLRLYDDKEYYNQKSTNGIKRYHYISKQQDIMLNRLVEMLTC